MKNIAKSTKVLLILLIFIIALGIGILIDQKIKKKNTQTQATKCLAFTSTKNCMKIPNTWSGYLSDDLYTESKPDDFDWINPQIAASSGIVSFGDMNWEQVNFYYSTASFHDWQQEFKKRANDYQAKIQSTTIGGRDAIYLQYPLDNGEVTKGGTGGQDYAISIGNKFSPTLIIRKQSLGSVEFEKNFQILINSINF